MAQGWMAHPWHGRGDCADTSSRKDPPGGSSVFDMGSLYIEQERLELNWELERDVQMALGRTQKATRDWVCQIFSEGTKTGSRVRLAEAKQDEIHWTQAF